MPWLAGLLLIAWCGLAAAGGRLAIIIDDVGNDYLAAEEVLELPPEVTVSVLPRLHNSARIARRAHRQGREVMLHQPMQALQPKPLGPGGLTLAHTRADLASVLRDNLASVPHAAGVNNHMGSLLTAEADCMRHFMAVLKQQGDMYFVDSRTHDFTHAEATARESGLRTARRDVFIDHVRDPAAIRAQLLHAADLARKRGSAIAIGHPYPETLAALRELLPQWQQQGMILLPVSEVIAHQRSPGSWHASSSPLPKVAKNSKQ